MKIKLLALLLCVMVFGGCLPKNFNLTCDEPLEVLSVNMENPFDFKEVREFKNCKIKK